MSSESNDAVEGGGGAGAQTDPPGAASTTPAPASFKSAFSDLAIPVTRQVQISGPSDWKHLVSGVDSLDLGFYVDWGEHWAALERSLLAGKLAAERTEGIKWEYPSCHSCIIYSRGKGRMYAFSLRSPHLLVGIARRESAADYPNVYVSLLAETIWQQGPIGAVKRAISFVESLGGKIESILVSRIDLCTDFLIPGGLSLDFLRHAQISRSRKHSHHMDGDCLETYYIGNSGASLRARIYDKAKEIVANDGDKLWFLPIWKIEACKDIWRVEFQLRREMCQQLGLNSVEDLSERSGGAWRYLTEDWLSLRVADNDNVSRRSVHLFWRAVQEAGEDFGTHCKLSREYSKGGQAPSQWYVSHAAGCIVGYAARIGEPEFDAALGELSSEMVRLWSQRDFKTRYQIERIKLGFDDSAEGGSDDKAA